ncbi:MAG: hypothetical protein M3454_14110 [Actinomycetota bacterium]|nr:hypothetical protein [Actinomycetota bacterium]
MAREPGMRMAAAKAFDNAPPQWSVDLYTEPPPECDVVLVCPDVPDPRPPGVISFDPADSAEVLRKIMSRAAGRRLPLVSVTGPGRGCGVTSLALHLSRALVAFGTVCFVDLDEQWGAAHRLGLEPGALKSWRDFDGSAESVSSCALPTPGGFRALFSPLPASLGSAELEPRRPDEGVLLAEARSLFEAVVVDISSPSVFERTVPHCEVAVLVLPPSRPAAARARCLLEAWPALTWMVVTNRMGPGGETTRSELEHILGRRISLELPCAPSLRDAEDDGRLLTSGLSRWIRRVERLARALAR